MIRKLRRKFICISMGMVGLVLLALVCSLLITTVRHQETSCAETLDFALSDRNPDSAAAPRFPTDGQKPPLKPDGFDAPRSRSFFVVQLSDEGEIESVSRTNLTLLDEDAETAVQAALATGKTEGTLRDLSLSFRIAEKSDGTRIAFADRTGDWFMLRQLAVTCALVLVPSLAALLVISLYLSCWALRPVERAWDQQRQFVADASHELKTPLTVILANTQLTLSNPDSTVRSQRKWLENTKEEGLRMKKLVDDLLFLAKADADRIQAPLSEISLSDTVWSAVLPFESVAFERGLTLESDIEPNLTVQGNEAQLRQAVGILLDNACKYAGPKGRITVELKKEQNKPLLTVRNTGDPIPPEALPHLFERFYRAGFSRDRDAGGYGLGLSILDTIVRSFGGRITVESRAETGTAFTLHFPA